MLQKGADIHAAVVMANLPSASGGILQREKRFVGVRGSGCMGSSYEAR